MKLSLGCFTLVLSIRLVVYITVCVIWVVYVAFRQKGDDTNNEAESEFRRCAALALRHPYKCVLTCIPLTVKKIVVIGLFFWCFVINCVIL